MSEKLTRKELLDLLNEFSVGEKGHSPDPLDQKALDGYQYLDRGLNAEDSLKKLDDRFGKWIEGKEVSSIRKSPKVRRFILLQRIAAAVLLVLVPLFFLLKPTSTSKLADHYFEAPRSPYLTISRGEQPTGEAEINHAFTLYEKGQYAEAAKDIGRLTIDHPDKQDLKFYHAISLLASGDYVQSIRLLKECTEEPFQELHQRSPWYLALAYLKAGDKEEARHWLQRTMLVDELHKEPAEELLQKIK